MSHGLAFNALLVLWCLGLVVTFINFHKMTLAPLRESLPFPHHNDEPDEFEGIKWMCSAILQLMLVIAPRIFAYALLWFQNDLIWRSQSVAVLTSENLIIFWISGVFLAAGLYSGVYQSIVNRHSDYEIHRVFWSYRSSVPLWDIIELNALLRKQRLRNAAFLMAMWFFAVGTILLGLDSYVEVVPDGMNINGFWSLAPKKLVWSEFQGAELSIEDIFSGKGSSSRPCFRIFFNESQPIDVIGSSTSLTSQTLKPTYDIAKVMCLNGLPITVCALPTSWSSGNHYRRQSEIQELWRDVQALPGVTTQAASE